MVGRGAQLVLAAAVTLAVAGCARDSAVESAARVGAGVPTAAADRYRVRPGETLSGLAERFGLPLTDLARANRIKPPYQVAAGQTLVVPGRKGDREAAYTVRAGETLAGIAGRHGVRLGDIVGANPGIDPDRVRAGQRIRLPGEVAMPAAPLMSEEEVELVRKAGQARPPSLSGDGFAWPVGGRVVSPFGPKDDGTRNDGVNIAVAAGTPVRAAENGLVVYAGDGLAGYGQTLLIRHAGNFTTAYSHNQKLLVKVGDRVKRLQKIAVVGATGAVRQAQLHFELRAGRQPIDPQVYLDSGAGRTEVAGGGGPGPSGG